MACSSISDGSGRLVELSGFGRWHAGIVPSLDASHALSDVRRILAGFLALTWVIVPGFGLVDLSVTWDPAWPQVLEAGWGLYMTLFVGIPFTAIAVRRRVARRGGRAAVCRSRGAHRLGHSGFGVAARRVGRSDRR
jgi:hypothetical protein